TRARLGRHQLRALTLWLLGAVVRHQPCRQCGTRLSRQHAAACANIATLLRSPPTLFPDLQAPDPATGGTLIDSALLQLGPDPLDLRDSTTRQRLRIIIQAIEKIRHDCLGQPPFQDIEYSTRLDEFAALLKSASTGNRPVSRDTYNSLTDIGRNVHDSTPLHAATFSGHLDVARFLLETGSEIDIRDGRKNTPLFNAALEGHLSLVELLVEKGADIEARGLKGRTSLHNAASGGHLDIARFLIEKGAKIDEVDFLKKTPLTFATLNGHLDIVQLLVEKGASMETTDKWKETPLIVAVANGHLSIVEYMVVRGANVGARDRDGRTARDCALWHGNTAVAEFLAADAQGTNSSIYLTTS
ncbi:hypothetical protein HDU96_009208, partial [Phlyctochytrium bullatum]